MGKMLMVALVGVAVAVTGTARAEIIGECGAFEGYSYYYPGKNVKPSSSGWAKDKISSGSTSITLIDKQFDVIYSGTVSKNRSSRANGAQIILLGTNPDEASITLLVGYPGVSAEFYTYHGLSKTLTLQTIRFNQLINSAKLLVAKCR
jgi:hypothetical protein